MLVVARGPMVVEYVGSASHGTNYVIGRYEHSVYSPAGA
jgi:hypothetical protein